MKKYPNVTLKVIFRWKNEIMILKHKNGVFSFPGGRMEWGESIPQALNRELREELNYSLKSELELFDVWNYVSKNQVRHSVMIYFIQQLARKPELSSPEKLKVLWFNNNSVLLKNIIKDKSFIAKIFNWRSKK